MIRGGRRVSCDVAGIRVVVAREDDPPFAVNGAVVEEDTWLALGAPTGPVSSPTHPLRVMTRVWEAKPEAPGTVIVTPGAPLRLHAVVHDLNEEPSWKEAWVRAALCGIFEQAEQHGIRTLRLPLLATKYGGLPTNDFMGMLRAAIDRQAACSTRNLRSIWLVRDGESGAELLDALAASEPHDH